MQDLFDGMHQTISTTIHKKNQSLASTRIDKTSSSSSTPTTSVPLMQDAVKTCKQANHPAMGANVNEPPQKKQKLTIIPATAATTKTTNKNSIVSSNKVVNLFASEKKKDAISNSSANKKSNNNGNVTNSKITSFFLSRK